MLLGLQVVTSLCLRLEEGLRLGEDLLDADDLVAVLVQGLHEVDDLRLGGDEAGGPDQKSFHSQSYHRTITGTFTALKILATDHSAPKSLRV